jgi:hypothetical protein
MELRGLELMGSLYPNEYTAQRLASSAARLDPMVMSRNFDVLAAILGAAANIPLTYPDQRQIVRSRALSSSPATVASGCLQCEDWR